jgi:HSP20 family protein
MAQETKRGQSNLPQTSQSGTGTGSLRRRGEYPSFFSHNPEEFFRMSPFQLMRHFSDEMDRMWSGQGSYGQTSRFHPTVDVCERNGQMQIHADLPGMSDKDVKVSVENDTLIIEGERKREENREEQGWHRSERSYGTFYRAIPLPENAQVENANARFNNGVLEVSIPLNQQQQQENKRQIPISTGGQSSQTGQSGQTNQTPGQPGQSGTSSQSAPTGQSTSTQADKVGRAGGGS